MTGNHTRMGDRRYTEGPHDPCDGSVLLLHRAHPRPPRDPDRRPPRLGREATYLALGQPPRAPLVRETDHGIPPLPGDLYSPLPARAPVLRRLLGARGGFAR